MKTKLDQAKLEELHQFIQKTENINREKISEYLQEDPLPWIDALKEKYPDVYDVADDDSEPQKETPKRGRKPSVKEDVKEKPTTYALAENGIKVELAFKTQKGNQVILEKIEPTDKVAVIVKGEEVMIDLLKLERESAKLGVPIGHLQILGSMAKG